MRQLDPGLSLTTRRTLKCRLLAQTERVVPWPRLEPLIAPHAPEGRRGRPSFAVAAMPRSHFMHGWFTFSGSVMEEALHYVPRFRDFAPLSYEARLPDESAIQRFQHVLEERKFAEQIRCTVNGMLQAENVLPKAVTVVDAALIARPGPSKNSSGERDPDLQQTEKSNQPRAGMKEQIRVGADGGFEHAVKPTAAGVNGVVEAKGVLHVEGTHAIDGADLHCSAELADARQNEPGHVGMRPGNGRVLDKTCTADVLADQLKHLKVSIQANIKHLFVGMRLETAEKRAQAP